MSAISLTLYIAGQTPRSERAIADLRRLGEEHLGGEYDLTVIDAAENPEAAEADRILATPTLLKTSPPPVRRITGDLSDPERVLAGLSLTHRPSENREREVP